MSGVIVGVSVQTSLAAGLRCRVAGRALICPMLLAREREHIAEGRAEAVCPGLGKSLSSSPDLVISFSTVSMYQHTLSYPKTSAEINEEVFIGLAAVT